VGNLFEDGNRNRVAGGVAHAQVNDIGVARGEKFLAFASEDNVRLAGFFAANFHIMPSERSADANAEGFGDGFLGGETRGDVWNGIRVREAVSGFFGDENALKEAAAMLLPNALDARDFNQIDAYSNYHAAAGLG
jgi:hypothetical protein